MSMRYHLRGVGPPFESHQEIIDYLFEPSEHIKKVVLQCGRRFGKTILSIDVSCRLLDLPYKTNILYLQPDTSRMAKVFWKQWRDMVPERYYKERREESSGRKYIEWVSTGNFLYPAIRNVHGNQQDVADSFRGVEFTNILDDECAIKFNLSQYTNTFNCLTGESPVRFYLNFTTPKAGSYGRLTRLPGVKMFYGKTVDNPYLMARHPHYVRDASENMTSDEILREFGGELIALEGRVFREAKIDPVGPNGGPAEKPDRANKWPMGNVHWDHAGFQEGKPWWILCDLGSLTGAYTVFQSTSSRGRFRGDVWVAIADYCSDSDGSASRAFQALDREFGVQAGGNPPAGVCAGGDIDTRENTHGSTVAYYVRRMWGSSTLIYAARESRAHKTRQLDIMNRMICTNKGHRRFTVAKGFRSIEPDSRRGIRETLLEYTHKPIDEREDGYVIPKGAKYPLCHCADAMLMGSEELMSPPQWIKQLELTE
jgi:hypothetical protein